VGASYSSYEVDYDQNNSFTGDKFFFTDVPGQSYTGEEEDFDAGGNLSRVLLTGVSGQAYSSLELDYSVGSYTGYKAYYDVAGQSFTSEEVDVSAANAITKVVYSGLSGTPYSSVQEDYSNGGLTDTVYNFTNVSGASAYAYQVREDANGNPLQETFDNNDGSHTLLGLTNNQTLTSRGNDTMTGGGSGASFVFSPVYGQTRSRTFPRTLRGRTMTRSRCRVRSSPISRQC
jgi:hypothetical protein